MTEEIAATPGWVEERLDTAFAGLPATEAVVGARRAYAECLAGRKAPAAPSDVLGAEDEPCDQALMRALHRAGVAADGLQAKLEALEAELAEDS